MLNNKKLDLNLPVPEEESMEKYENGNILFSPEGASDARQIEITKRIIEAVSQYMDNRVHIQYKKMLPSNPGFNARLNPEFRDADYRDSVSINPDYEFQDELPFFILHELGHSFEEKMKKIIKERGFDALPVLSDGDYDGFYAEFCADLVSVYALRPESLKKLNDNPIYQNTLIALKEMFEGRDFSDLREKLDELSVQETVLESGSKEEAEKRARMDKLFGRVFEKIEKYINHRNKILP